MRKKIEKLLIIIAAITPLLVIYGIWDPVLRAFHIENIEVSDETVMASRTAPNNHVIQKMKDAAFGNYLSISTISNIENIAEKLLRGEVNLETFPQRSLQMPFDNQAVFAGNSHWQLSYTSFLIPKLFLNAYTETDRSEFLIAALDFILGWDNFEQKNWSPESFVWNDHAVANRSEALGNFWYHYKAHPDFDIDKGRKLLKMAARNATFLARKLNYTFKTNHGTMQNLAVLKLVLFFPEVKEIQILKQTAVNNLIKQFDFFINEDGVILEHSAEYHSFGLRLISATFSSFKLLDVNIPDNLTEKYKQGLVFLKALRRPNGTLAKLGDTSEKFDAYGKSLITQEYQPSKDILSDKLYFRPESDTTFKPGSGYSVWWSNLKFWPDKEKLTQTAITWSYFPFMGHKHADELSFVLWKAGQEWWTSVGYWPFTAKHREDAISWTGANGPHLTDEKKNSDRKSTVLSHFESENIKVIDLLRQRPDGFKVRRQIINISDFIWITLDFFDDPLERRGQVVWNLHPSLQASPTNDPMNFNISGENTNLEMDVFFSGAEGMEIRKVHGIEKPMAGWMGSGQYIYQSDAFIINQKSNGSWISSISIIGENSKENLEYNTADVKWSKPEEWAVDMMYGGNKITVKRDGNIISVSNSLVNEKSTKINLETISKTSQSQKKIAAAYFDTEKIQGKRFMPFIHYRKKMTAVLTVLFGVNIAFLFFFRRFLIPTTVFSILSTSGLYYWLVNYYFIVNY